MMGIKHNQSPLLILLGLFFLNAKTQLISLQCCLLDLRFSLSLFLLSLCLHSCEDLESTCQEEMQVTHDLVNYSCV